MYSRQASRSASGAIQLSIAIGALLTGASLMYLFDPRAGRRRRALLSGQVNRGLRQSRDFAQKVRTDAQNRARGLYEQSRSALHGGATDDEIVAERARAALGRLCSHPGALEITCTDQVVHVGGDILSEEVKHVLHGIRSVRGVKDVVNELRVHESADSVPALQGEGRWRRTAPPEYLQGNWSPAPRVVAGAVGFGLIASTLGASRLNASTATLGLAGAAILLRAISNRPLTRTLGLGANAEDGFLIQKTLHVYAETDEVYAAWRALENFPSFMTHIREITPVEGGRYRWTVDGPAGVPVSWESEITADIPNELLAWRTVAGSPVQSTGVVQFEPSSYGGTRIHVRMSYRPPANAAGHIAAVVFGKDPRRQIDDDLMRLKSLLEVGKTTGNRGPIVRH
jgi:uncharacterized membrane protein